MARKKQSYRTPPRVGVVMFSDRPHWQMQWIDPITRRKRTQSTGVRRSRRQCDRIEAERMAASLQNTLRYEFLDHVLAKVEQVRQKKSKHSKPVWAVRWIGEDGKQKTLPIGATAEHKKYAMKIAKSMNSEFVSGLNK